MDYTGSCYVGVTGSLMDWGEAIDSVYRIALRPGDSIAEFHRFTKGYEARQAHINKFLESRHDFCLLLDQDMIYSVDTLERLRRHGLPYVSGLYMRRRHSPILPVWYEPWAGSWPFTPWYKPIERGKLHKLGASGWGCILIHREVVLAVRKLLKGEHEVLEDAMTLYPYDLQRVMAAISGLALLLDERPDDINLYPALSEHVRALREEIKPNRADKDDVVGSDLRFPFYAMKAGYPLMGDPDVRPRHVLDYAINCEDYDQQLAEAGELIQKDTMKMVAHERSRIRAARRAASA